MTFLKLTVLAGLLVALSGCVFPFGYSTGPGDDRSPYLSNDGDRDATPNPGDRFQPSQTDSLN
jgi:hypothetical protein